MARAALLHGHLDPVRVLCLHPTLPLLFSGSAYPDCTVRIWDLETRSLLRTLAGHTHCVWGLALDPSGTRLASGSWDETVRLWDLQTCACLCTLTGISSDVNAVAWEAAGRILAAGSSDRSIRLWHADSGVLRHTLEGHLKPVLALAAHPERDLLASGSSDTTVRVWRFSSGESLRKLAGHTAAVTSLASSEKWLVSGSLDRTVRVWSWRSHNCARVLETAGKLYWNSLAWRDSRMVTLDGEHWNGTATVRLWETGSDRPSAFLCVGSLRREASSTCGVAVVEKRVVCGAPGDSRTTAIAVWATK